MKFLIVFAFVATIAAIKAETSLKEEQQAQFKKHVEQCREEIKITDEEFANLNTAELDNASQDVKCLANCVLEKDSIFKDGALQEALSLEKFGPTIGEEKVKKVLSVCGGEKGADKCETAYKFHKCFIKTNGGLV